MCVCMYFLPLSHGRGMRSRPSPRHSRPSAAQIALGGLLEQAVTGAQPC